MIACDRCDRIDPWTNILRNCAHIAAHLFFRRLTSAGEPRLILPVHVQRADSEDSADFDRVQRLSSLHNRGRSRVIRMVRE